MKGLCRTMISRYSIKILLLFFFSLTVFQTVRAQEETGQVIDRIIAKVDDYIILKSDLDKAYLEYVSRGEEGGEEVRCGIYESLVINKLLVAKAEIDSVEILDAEVQLNLEQRMAMVIQQIGSEERLEEYYGKSVEQFEEELFDDIKEQMLADKMQRNITADITVTPSEVKRFFNRIPADSLPYFSTEVSVGQIVKIPDVGKEQKALARNQIMDIRNRIVNGKDQTGEYGGWTINIDGGDELELVDKEGTTYSGTYVYDGKERLFTITLNEISFSANEFQYTWKMTKAGNDSIIFNNSDVNNTAKFVLVKRNNRSKESPVINLDFLIGSWNVVSFHANGADFADLAKEYSEDPGSARLGGELGYARRGTMVPEFEAAAMRMKPGEISMPIETDFGFHLIQLLDRRGNEFNSRHILLRPDFSSLDFEQAENYLDSLRREILEDSLVFEKAAKEYSDDKETAGNGGFLVDANGSSLVSVEDLDPVIFFSIDTMDVGDISMPTRYRMRDGKEAVRILYYKSRIKPHRANFKDDYQKIQIAAINDKKSIAMEKWFGEAKNEVFIQIADDYQHCKILE